MTTRIQYTPPGILNTQAGAIRSPLSAGALLCPMRELLNWLMQYCKQGLIFHGAYSGADSALSSRIYHRPGSNCDKVLVLALIERSTYALGGTITFVPSNGAGTPISHTERDISVPVSRFPIADRGWGLWFDVATLTTTGLQYHEIVWSQLVVRHLFVWELPSYQLDYDSGDDVIEERAGDYAGLCAGRSFTDSAKAGLAALVQGTRDARDNTRRHLLPLMVPDANAWAGVGTGAYANLADAAIYTSNFVFPHQARRIRQATTVVPYNARIRARYVGTGTAAFRLRSASDSVMFTSLTSSFAWHAPDSSATLDISATATDGIYPEYYGNSGSISVEVSSIQFPGEA